MPKPIWIMLIVVFIALDQVSKYLCETLLPLHHAIPLIPTIDLFRTYNYGVAFSMLSFLNGWPLNLITIAIIGFIIWLWRSVKPDRQLSLLGYSLIIGGAIGNVIDRIRLGKVVDMILFHIESLNFQFAVFNVADAFITMGAAAIILDEFLYWRREKSTKAT